MNQEISISRFGDPFLSEHPFFVWGPIGCGKLSRLKNILDEKSPKYLEISGCNFQLDGRVMIEVENCLKNKGTIIINGLDISEKSIENLLDKLDYSKSIFLVGDFYMEENIPNYIKSNFKIISHTEIDYFN